MKTIRLLVLAILFGNSIAFADIVLVPDFRVDQDPMQNTLIDVASSIDFGYFVVFYRYTGNNGDLYAHRYNLSGNPLGIPFRVESAPDSASANGWDVIINTLGETIFLWWDNRSGSAQVYFKKLDSSGNIVITDTIFSISAYPDNMAALPGGGFVVAYDKNQAVDPDIYAKIYDSFGNPIGDEFRVDQNPNVDYNCGYSARPIVAANSTGRIYLAWSDSRNYCDSSSPDSVYARIFDSAGNPLSNEFRVSLDALGYVIGATSIATTSNGNFIIAWHEQMPLYIVSDVFARAYDSSGAPLADEFKVNQVASNASNGDIACAPSGRCLILYTGNMGRHLNSNGVLLDAEFVISPASTVVAAAIAGNNSFLSVRSGYIVDAPIMANIMGPNDAIPTTSGALLIILAALFMVLIIFASKRKILGGLIVLLILILFNPQKAQACNPNIWLCDGTCGCDASTECGCNTVNPTYTLTTIHGDASRANNRIDIFFIPEGWAADQQALYNESVNAFMDNLKNNPTYAEYFDFFNLHRINIVAPESGISIEYNGGAYSTHYLTFDDEDQNVFSATGDWQFVSSPNAFSGSGYHIIHHDPLSTEPIKATWSFVVPADLGDNPLLFISPSWSGNSSNVPWAKYTITKNGVSNVVFWDQRLGNGKYIQWGRNFTFQLQAAIGDSIEISVEPRDNYEGNIIADSIFISNVTETVPKSCRNTFFNTKIGWNYATNSRQLMTDNSKIITFLKTTLSNDYGISFVAGTDQFIVVPNVNIGAGWGCAAGWQGLPVSSPSDRPRLMDPWNRTIPHELGHSQGQLYDEHHGGACINWDDPYGNGNGQEPYYPNVTWTQTTQTYGFKWAHLISRGELNDYHPYCFAINPDTGAWEPTGYNQTSFIPHQSCVMDGYFNPGGAQDFGLTCKENVIRELYTKINILDKVNPAYDSQIHLYDGEKLILNASSLTTQDGIDGSNTISLRWRINRVEIQNGGNSFVVNSADLNIDTNSVVVSADDSNDDSLVEKHRYCYGWPTKSCGGLFPSDPDYSSYDSLNLLLPKTTQWTIVRHSGTGPSTGPVISNISVSNLAVGEYQVSADISDGGGTEAGIKDVGLVYKLGGGDFQLLEMKFQGGNYKAVIKIPAGILSGTIQYFIQAEDNEGLVARSPADSPTTLHSFDFTIPDTTPPIIIFVSQHPDTGNIVSATIYAHAEDTLSLADDLDAKLWVSINSGEWTYSDMAYDSATGIFQGDVTPQSNTYNVIEYYLEIIDAAGNSAAYPDPSEALTFKVDNLGPNISIVSQHPDTGNTPVNPVTINATASDDTAMGSVDLIVSFDGCLTYQDQEMAPNSDSDYFVNVVQFLYPAEMTVCYHVLATDVYGNSSISSPEYTFNVDNVSPTISTDLLGFTTDINGPYIITTTVTDPNMSLSPSIILYYGYSYFGWGEIQSQTPITADDQDGDNFSFSMPGPGYTSKIYYYISASDEWGNRSFDPISGDISSGYFFSTEDVEPPILYDTTRLPDTTMENGSYVINTMFSDNNLILPPWNIVAYVSLDGGYPIDYWPELITPDPETVGVYQVKIPIGPLDSYAPDSICYYVEGSDVSYNYVRDPLSEYCFNIVYPFTPGTIFAAGEVNLDTWNSPIYTLNLSGMLQQFIEASDILDITPGVIIGEEWSNAQFIGVHALAYDPINDEVYFTYEYLATSDVYPYAQIQWDAIGKFDAAKNITFVRQSNELYYAGYSQDIVFMDSGLLLGTMQDGILWYYDPGSGQFGIVEGVPYIDGWWQPLATMGDVLFAPGDPMSQDLLKIWVDANGVHYENIPLPVDAAYVREIAADEISGSVYMYIIEPDGSKIWKYDSILGGAPTVYANLGFPLQGNGPAMEVDPLVGEIVLQQFVNMIDPTYTGGGWSLYYVLEGDTKESLLSQRITPSTIYEPAGDVEFAFVSADPNEIIDKLITDVTQLSIDETAILDMISSLESASEDIGLANYGAAVDHMEEFSTKVSLYSMKIEERDHFITWAGVVIEVVNRLGAP